MNLVLCLTEQCNLRCSYCYYKDTQSARHNVMDDETLEQAIRVGLERSLFFKQTYLNITFFGGEPLLRKDAIFKGVNIAKAFLAEAMDKGEAPSNFKLNFAVNTNGTLFDDSFFDFCEREHFRIYLSLDGPEHHHDIARRTINNDGSFKDIEKHIPRFVKLGAVALSTVTRAHIETLAESVKWDSEALPRASTLTASGPAKILTGSPYNTRRWPCTGRSAAKKVTRCSLARFKTKSSYTLRIYGIGNILAMYTTEPLASQPMAICSRARGSLPRTKIRLTYKVTSLPDSTKTLANKLDSSWTTTKRNAKAATYATAAVRTNAPARAFIARVLLKAYRLKSARMNACSQRFVILL